MTSTYVKATVRHHRSRKATGDELDEVAVERAVKSRGVRLYPAEKSEVVRILTERRWSAARIARHLGTSNRTVTRIRAEHVGRLNRLTVMSAVWRYLYCGSVLHALARVDDLAALCGAHPVEEAYWHGTGSQDEYERAERLPACERCQTIIDRVTGRVASHA